MAMLTEVLALLQRETASHYMGALRKGRDKDSPVENIPARSDGHLQGFEYKKLSWGIDGKCAWMLTESRHRKSQRLLRKNSIYALLLFCSRQVQRQKSHKNFIIGYISLPAICIGNSLVQNAMGVIEPSGPFVVEIGESAFLQYLCGGFVLGQDAVRIARPLPPACV